MTPGMSGSIKELAEKKKRYLVFVKDWIKQSLEAIGKVDSKDPDYAYYEEMMSNALYAVESASDIVDELVSWSTKKG